MSVTLDETLIARSRRKPRIDALSHEDMIAVNVFWRKGVKVTVLAKVFHVSKNTLYTRALTGPADPASTPLYAGEAKEINELVDHMGVEAAMNLYTTSEMIQAVNAAMKEDVEQRDARAA